MNNISSDEIINNIKKFSDKYQEIILCLMQGKGNMIPPPLVDMDKNRIILASLSEQFINNPEKFWQLNIEYIKKFQNFLNFKCLILKNSFLNFKKCLKRFFH